MDRHQGSSAQLEVPPPPPAPPLPLQQHQQPVMPMPRSTAAILYDSVSAMLEQEPHPGLMSIANTIDNSLVVYCSAQEDPAVDAGVSLARLALNAYAHPCPSPPPAPLLLAAHECTLSQPHIYPAPAVLGLPLTCWPCLCEPAGAGLVLRYLEDVRQEQLMTFMQSMLGGTNARQEADSAFPVVLVRHIDLSDLKVGHRRLCWA